MIDRRILERGPRRVRIDPIRPADRGNPSTSTAPRVSWPWRATSSKAKRSSVLGSLASWLTRSLFYAFGPLSPIVRIDTDDQGVMDRHTTRPAGAHHPPPHPIRVYTYIRPRTAESPPGPKTNVWWRRCCCRCSKNLLEKARKRPKKRKIGKAANRLGCCCWCRCARTEEGRPKERL